MKNKIIAEKIRKWAISNVPREKQPFFTWMADRVESIKTDLDIEFDERGCPNLSTSALHSVFGFPINDEDWKN